MIHPYIPRIPELYRPPPSFEETWRRYNAAAEERERELFAAVPTAAWLDPDLFAGTPWAYPPPPAPAMKPVLDRWVQAKPWKFNYWEGRQITGWDYLPHLDVYELELEGKDRVRITAEIIQHTDRLQPPYRPGDYVFLGR